MRNLKSLLLAAVALVGVLAFTSCSDDDDNKKFIILNGQTAKFGTTEGTVWTDATVFNGKFYSLVVSVTKGDSTTTENYELYNSTDGQTWTKVDYTVDGGKGLIGGEGARLVVNGGKLYVFGGLRTMGADIYGGAAEMSQGWTGLAPDSKFRVWESADGTAFTSVSDVAMTRNGNAVAASMLNMYANHYANVVSFGGKMVVQGGYMIAYGMAQPSRALMTSADGKNWTWENPIAADSSSVSLPQLGTVTFELNGKLYVAGGFNNFIGASYMNTVVCSTSDLTTWTVDSVTTLPKLYQAKAVSTGTVAYIIGGEQLGEDETTRSLVPAIYRTTDGVSYTKVTDTPTEFTGYRLASAAAIGGYAYIFGGYTTVSNGYYAAPSDADTYSTKSWNLLMK